MKEIFNEIAESENLSEEEVRDGIAECIGIAMQSDLPQAKAFWSEISPDGKELSTEEVLQKLVDTFEKRKFYM